MEVACELALEAPEGLHAGLALGFLALEVCLGRGVPASARDRDDVQRAVEASVAAAVQAVALVFARGRGDRCDAGHPREVRVGGEPLGAGGLPDQDRGGDRAAAELGEQLRPVGGDEGVQLALELAGLAGELADLSHLLFRDPHPR